MKQINLQHSVSKTNQNDKESVNDMCTEDLDLGFLEQDSTLHSLSNAHPQNPQILQKRPKKPKFSQVLKSINLLKHYFPTTFTDEFIDQIYNKSILNPHLEKDETQPFSEFAKSEHETVVKQEERVTEMSVAEQIRQIVLSVFCRKQRNYECFQEQLLQSKISIQISEQDYNNLLEQQILEAYDYVCEKVSRDFNITVHILDRKQTSILVELFCRCTLSFSKLIQGLTKKDRSKVLSAEEARKVYNAVIRSIRSNLGVTLRDIKGGKFDGMAIGREVNVRPPMDIRTKKAKLEGLDYLKDTRRKKIVHELQAHWNQNLEKILIQLYKERYHFSYIRDYFQSNYPTHKELFTVLSVRSKLFKILRVGIRKLYYFVANYGEDLPQLINLDDERIKILVYSQETLHLRILVLCVYELKKFHFETIRKTIEACNSYFLVYEGNRQNHNEKENGVAIIFNEKDREKTALKPPRKRSRRKYRSRSKKNKLE